MIESLLIDPQLEIKKQETAVGFISHTYQPPREVLIDLSFLGIEHQVKISVAPEFNQRITEQVYKPLFGLGEDENLSPFPPGWVFSCFASLRSYFKLHQPQLWQTFKNRLSITSDKEYTILADPWLHVILPLLPSDDQAMLIELGKQAFKDDFGFDSAGFWLPETAVSFETLALLVQEGYEFVVLRDDQLKLFGEKSRNPNFAQIGELKVLIGNKSLGKAISFNPETTTNADRFAQELANSDNPYRIGISDTEFYGHHGPGRDQFLLRALKTSFKDQQLNLLNVRYGLMAELTQAEVNDGTSWSCDHQLGRWTGKCNCGNNGPPSEAIINERNRLYLGLTANNHEINELLDEKCFGWRNHFIKLILPLRDLILSGQDFVRPFWKNGLASGLDEQQLLLLLAKLETLIGFTSCGWFFGEVNSPEVAIPQSMLDGSTDLLKTK